MVKATYQSFWPGQSQAPAVLGHGRGRRDVRTPLLVPPIRIRPRLRGQSVAMRGNNGWRHGKLTGPS